MTDDQISDITMLYRTAINEFQNDEIQQINLEFYRILSKFIGKIKTEEYCGLEAKIKNEIFEKTSMLIELIMKIRLEKAITNEKLDKKNLLDEEKFIIDSSNEMIERNEMILSGIFGGKTKVLESISQNYKTKPISVRFLKDVEQIIGADSEAYGPFKLEDIATIPNENAQELIVKNLAVNIHIDK